MERYQGYWICKHAKIATTSQTSPTQYVENLSDEERREGMEAKDKDLIIS